MDQFQTTPDEPRPEGGFYPHQAPARVPGLAVAPVAPNAEAARRLTRQQVLDIRKAEQAGVPFFLHRTGVEATVRALSFGDKAMLAGLPAHLQYEMTAAFNQSGKGGANANKTFSDYVRAAAADERVANVACVAMFIWPRLVLTEAELDGSDDCWLVTDLHIDERKRAMSLALGNAGEEDLKRIAGFLDARLARDATD